MHRQVQLELQLGIAISLGLRQRMLGQRINGTAAHGREHVRQRPTGLRIDQHAGLVEIGNLCAGLVDDDARVAVQNALGLVDLHAVAFKHQLAREAMEFGPGLVARVQVRVGHIGIAHIAHRRDDTEQAMARIGKRHFPEVALDLELHIAGLAGQHGIAHIVARIGRNMQWQITVHLRAIGPVKHALEFQNAGKARLRAGLLRVCRVPAPARMARRMRIGEFQPFGLHLDAIALHRPLQLGVGRGDWQQRLFKDRRQVERAIGKAQFGLPPASARLDGQIQPAQAGVRLPGGQHQAAMAVTRGIGLGCRSRHAKGQLAHIGLDLPVLPAVDITAPVGRCTADQTGRPVALQPLACVVGDGQQPRQLGQGGDIERLGTGLGLAGLLALRIDVVDAGAAAGPLLAVGRFDRQVLRQQAKAAVIGSAADAALHRAQQQHRALRRFVITGSGGWAAHAHIAQGDIGGAVRKLATRHIQPQPCRALALLQTHRRRQIGRHRRSVELERFEVDLTAPVLPVAIVQRPQRLVHAAAQLQRIPPVFGRAHAQLPFVAQARVAQQQMHIAESDGGQAAQLVIPDDAAALQQHLALAEQPVASTAAVAVLRGIDQHAGHAHTAIGSALHRQLRRVDDDLLGPQPQQRRHRQRHLDRIQGKPCGSIGLLDAQPFDRDRRHQTVMAFGLQTVNAHRHAERLRQPRFHLRAKVIDTGHNPPMQRRHGQSQQQRQAQQ